jgi:hypothetical protein
MNKLTINIEPENDITDIISKIKGAKSKVVVLVPARKSALLSSAINIKLLSKTARGAKKNLVVITSDPAIINLATASGIATAKAPNARPNIPTPDDVSGDGAEKGIDSAMIEKERQEADDFIDEDADLETEVINSIDLSADDQSSEVDRDDNRKKDKKARDKVPTIERVRKWIILGVIAAILLAGFLVWALVFAPAVEIAVSIRTTAKPFSEIISFTADAKKADPNSGLFLLEEQKITKESSVIFTPTGEKDLGEKAAGSLTFSRTTVSNAAIAIGKDTVFSHGDLKFVTMEDVTLRAPAEADLDVCGIDTCMKTGAITATVKIQAVEAGSNYNIPAATSGWLPSNNGYSVTSTVTTGGSSKIVTIVTQKDINNAKEFLATASESAGKAELTKVFSDSLIPIASSLFVETKDPVSVPKLGESLEEGEEAKLVAETTFAMYGVDSTKVDEYITAKASEDLQSELDQMVHSIGEPFVEQFTKNDKDITAKLKTTLRIGPKITEEDILNKSMGRKIGEVQSILKSINGVGTVSIKPSVFWVASVPNDPNKVTINLNTDD